jgi:hypothetical protein
MFMRRKMLFFAPIALAGMILFAFLGGEVVKLLWNWLMPALFDWRPITFWQAIGLLALCRILFGGFGGRGMAGSNMRRRMSGRWQQLTPEQRDRFRDAFRHRWGMTPEGDAQDI